MLDTGLSGDLLFVRKDKNEESKIEIADDMLKEKKEVDFRRARHKELYDEVKGNIMYCADELQLM